MLNQIATSVEDLRAVSKSAYLYGSQVARPDPNNDVDLLFVIDGDRKAEAVRKMRRIQGNSKYLLHPTFVSADTFGRNPYFVSLIKGGIQLW